MESGYDCPEEWRCLKAASRGDGAFEGQTPMIAFRPRTVGRYPGRQNRDQGHPGDTLLLTIYKKERNMKVCFPVQMDHGIDSTVFNHFGSAPMFVVVDTGTNALTTINNRDQHHSHGACNPMNALDNQKVDAIVVGGIGAGALTRLNQMGIRVHRSQAVSIRENMAMLKSQTLPAITLQGCCGGHSNDGGCAH